jgi:hypothetical protein
MRLFVLTTALAVALSAAPSLAAAPTGQPVGPHHVECNVNEVLTEHLHAHLSITAHGNAIHVPGGIGIVVVGGNPVCFYWLHTHDDSGLIHVEAPMGTFTLADFFAVWGQELSATRIGRFTGHVTAKVNGAPYHGAPGTIPLLDNEQIALSVT